MRGDISEDFNYPSQYYFCMSIIFKNSILIKNNQDNVFPKYFKRTK